MKNDIITASITAITPDGYGLGRVNGKVVFVPDTAIGDTVEAIIIKELKNSSVAKLLKVITPSDARIEPDCAVCRQCGGCVFRHISYEAEADLKRGFVEDALSRIGGIKLPVEQTVCLKSERYRNKVQYPFAPSGEGKCTFGYYARRSHRIVPQSDCPLQDKSFNLIANFCAEAADSLNIPAYDDISHSGILRHAVMRRNKKGEVMLCLVVSCDTHPKIKTLCNAVYEGFPEIIGVHINLNPTPGNVIFGEKTYKVCGSDYLCDELCGKKFYLSPRSFYQVNAPMAEKLYTKAKELLSAKDGSVILDLYCGVGTVGLCIASENDKLCGVEIIGDAVENAKRNAEENGRNTSNTLFVCGDASVGVEKCREKFGTPDAVIVDPPRKGLDASVIKTVADAAPKRVVYISCDPATLARDIKIFGEYGYAPETAYPYDLFPRTGHVETVVLLNCIK